MLGIQWVKFNGVSDETGKEIFDCEDTLYKNITKLKEIYEQGVTKGDHPVNTDYRSILTHEIGHAITWKIARDTGEYHSTLTKSLREEVLKETGFTIEDVANNLSRYAAEYDAMMAEFL
ncbi:MAG: hypothetical protein LBG84_05990 [Treponema sp.]|jgi:hypothetical protein|nr:hypothetical protein [Treponema sp.]